MNLNTVLQEKTVDLLPVTALVIIAKDIGTAQFSQFRQLCKNFYNRVVITESKEDCDKCWNKRQRLIKHITIDRSITTNYTIGCYGCDGEEIINERLGIATDADDNFTNAERRNHNSNSSMEPEDGPCFDPQDDYDSDDYDSYNSYDSFYDPHNDTDALY